jgi:senataxin
VRCLSDVIDVLCATTDGLFRDEAFQVKGKESKFNARIPTLWKLMCEALGLLFKKTEDWSKFYENEVMTEWMRDALLFGDEIVKHVRTFEQAWRGTLSTASSVTQSPEKATRDGQQMMNAFNKPLSSLIVWLRLNDEELLSASFDLVRAMLDRFAKSGVAVDLETVSSLKRIIEKGGKKIGADVSRTSQLRDQQLLDLIESLRGFNDDSDSVSEADSRSSRPENLAKRSHSSTLLGSGKGSKAIDSISIDDDDDDDVLIVRQKGKGKATSSSVSTIKGNSIRNAQSTLPFLHISAQQAARSSFPVARSSFPGKGTALKSNSASTNLNFGRSIVRNTARPKGIPWTTYSTSATNALDSSSGSSEEEEEGPRGLALLAKNQKSPKIKKVEQRRVKLLESVNAPELRKKLPLRPVAPQAKAVSARLRSVTDYSELHRKILQWDYNHAGDTPPNSTAPPRSIAASFNSFDEHFAAFEPLLLLECWAQIQQARQEATVASRPADCIIAGRQSVDDFTDIFITIMNAAMPERTHFGESDLVLLRQGPRVALAKVQSSGRKKDFWELTLRCHFGNDRSDASAGLFTRSAWEILKLNS